MFGFRVAKTEERKKSAPWFTLGWMIFLVLLFGWSQWGLSSKTKAVNQAKEKLACYFLKYDHTIIPPKIQKHLPKELQKHASRVTPYVELYYKAGMAREQARQWLSQGSGTRFNTSKPPQGMTCLQYAIRQGQFSQHPKRRLFREMASISTTTLEGHQQELQRLGQAYLKSRLSHPFYGWGLVPSDKNAVSWVTSTVISPGFLSLAWHLLLLWLLAGFLEAAWGGAIWLGFYWVGGIFGNILLMVLLSGSKQPILGSSLAITTIVGMWAVATLQRPIQVWGHQAIPTQKIPVVPSWMILAGWLGFSLLNTLILGYPVVSYILAQMVCFGLGVGGVVVLQYMEWLEEIPKPRAERSPALQERQRTRPNIRSFKRPEPGAKSLYLKPDLKEMVKHTYNNGQFQEAVGGFRELYKKGQARLEDFDGLFLACEKGNIAPEPDDFLRALRAAAFAKDLEKVQAYYMRFQAKRTQIHWSLREQISLAQELKRAGMYQETLQELESLLEEGPDGVFFMDALIIKAETLIAQGEELEQAMQLIYKAELYLQDNPTYKESVGRLRLLLADVDGGSIPEIRTVPKGLGGSDMFSEDQDQEGENLLENFDLFEQKLEEAERTNSADSWNELPSLLLRDKEKEQRFFEEITHPDSLEEDDDFLMGDNDIPVGENSKPETLETNPNTILSGSYDRFTGIPDSPQESLNPLTPAPPSDAPHMYGSQEMTRLEPHIVEELLGKLSYATPLVKMEPNIASPPPPSFEQQAGSADSWSSPSIPSIARSGLQEMSSERLVSPVSLSPNGQPYRPRLSNAFLEALTDGEPSTPLPAPPTTPSASAMTLMGVVYQEAPHENLSQSPVVESWDPGVPVSLYPQAQVQAQMYYSEPPLQHPGNATPFTHSPILELTEVVKDDDND